MSVHRSRSELERPTMWCARCSGSAYSGRPRRFCFVITADSLEATCWIYKAYHDQVKIDFSRPGKPTANANVESFNGTLRAECLDAQWFTRPLEGMERIECWTGPWARGLHTNLQDRSRLGAICLAQLQLRPNLFMKLAVERSNNPSFHQLRVQQLEVESLVSEGMICRICDCFEHPRVFRNCCRCYAFDPRDCAV